MNYFDNSSCDVYIYILKHHATYHTHIQLLTGQLKNNEIK